jgi:hypothetical protein
MGDFLQPGEVKQTKDYKNSRLLDKASGVFSLYSVTRTESILVFILTYISKL